jgi:hypothetical protein
VAGDDPTVAEGRGCFFFWAEVRFGWTGRLQAVPGGSRRMAIYPKRSPLSS